MDGAEKPTGTRDRVLVAATGLFEAQGIRGTSIEQVAEAAGLHRVTVHKVFGGGRDELVAEVLLGRAIEVLTLALPATDEVRSVGEILVDSFTSFVMQARSDPLLREGVCSDAVQLLLVPERFGGLVAMALAWYERIEPAMARAELTVFPDAERVTDLLARTVLTLVREPGIVVTEADVRAYLADFIIPAITRPAPT